MIFRIIAVFLSVIALFVGIFVVRTSLENTYLSSLSSVRETVIMKNNGKYDKEEFSKALVKINDELSNSRIKLQALGVYPDSKDVEMVKKLKQEMYTMNQSGLPELLQNPKKAILFLKERNELTEDEIVFYDALSGSPVFDRTLYLKLKKFITNNIQ